jgi:hypothetical protein
VAAPEYVPVDSNADPRTYGSPPRLEAPWAADRPGELVGPGQPLGLMLGNQGPDLGYALKLANSMRDRLALAPGEHVDDIIAGCTAVAMKRSALFGRAPVIHDLTLAFTIWGYLDHPPTEVVEARRELFAEVANHHHWAERRRIVDMVPDDLLRRSHTQVSVDDAKRLLGLAPAA